MQRSNPTTVLSHNRLSGVVVGVIILLVKGAP
jgi:hypothetical protein